LPYHPDTPRAHQIVTSDASSHPGQAAPCPAPTVTNHKIRARATFRVVPTDIVVSLNTGGGALAETAAARRGDLCLVRFKVTAASPAWRIPCDRPPPGKADDGQLNLLRSGHAERPSGGQRDYFA
jgi:hypothetical protein